MKTKGSWTVHRKRHLKQYVGKCEVCGQGFVTNQEYANHVGSKHGAVTHVCNICGRSCYDKAILQNHMARHEESYGKVGTVKCELCEKTFPTLMYLKRHNLRIHKNGGLRFICDLCGKEVSSKQSLRDHTFIHQGVKPIECPECDKSFVLRTTLRQHMRTHTGNRPYPCTFCNKCFTQRSPLIIHLRYHTGERPYKCDVCNTGFVSKAAMLLHQKCKHSLMVVLYQLPEGISIKKVVRLEVPPLILVNAGQPTTKPTQTGKGLLSKNQVPQTVNPTEESTKTDKNPLSRNQVPQTVDPIEEPTQTNNDPLSRNRVPRTVKPMEGPTQTDKDPLFRNRVPQRVDPIEEPTQTENGPLSRNWIPSAVDPIEEPTKTDKDPISRNRVPQTVGPTKEPTQTNKDPLSRYQVPQTVPPSIIINSKQTTPKPIKTNKDPLSKNQVPQTVGPIDVKEASDEETGNNRKSSSLDQDYNPTKQVLQRKSTWGQFAEIKKIRSESYYCKTCKEKFGSLEETRKHLDTCRIFEETCATCGKYFTKRSAYMKHLLTHRVKLKYYCDTCGQESATTFAFESHKKNYHTENFDKTPEGYVCKHCNEIFKDMATVNHHNLLIHIGVKSHLCDECGMEFFTKKNLDSHKVTHSLVIPFTCQYCDKTFKTNVNLTNHVKITHFGS